MQFSRLASGDFPDDAVGGMEIKRTYVVRTRVPPVQVIHHLLPVAGIDAAGVVVLLLSRDSAGACGVIVKRPGIDKR